MAVPGLIIGVTAPAGELIGARNGGRCLVHGVEEPTLETSHEHLFPQQRAERIAQGVIRDPESTVRYHDEPFLSLPAQQCLAHRLVHGDALALTVEPYRDEKMARKNGRRFPSLNTNTSLLDVVKHLGLRRASMILEFMRRFVSEQNV